MMIIQKIGKDQQGLWDIFVRAAPSGTYFHLYGWSEVIEKTYGLPALFLGAFENEQLVAVLPAILTKKRRSKGRAVSLAFGTYGGWLISPGVDQDRVQRSFMEFLAGIGVTSLENRFLGTRTNAIAAEQVTQRLALSASPDQLWKVFDPKVRNQIRKAQKEGLCARWGLDQLPEFFSIYSANMRHLGTPPHPLYFFEAVRDEFPEAVDILTIRLGDKPLAAMLLLKYANQLSDPWAASLREYASMCPNMLMYWESMKYGCEHGFVEFDLGRSRVGSGPFRFKAQWGAQAVSLNYQIFKIDGKGGLEITSPESSPLMPYVSRVWQFVPLGLSRRFGPIIRKRIV